ncbi:MAG: ABC transporter permease [Desulfarculus sp.]|jgi:lipopolysaccharide transport system permease protein|nr:ABC transporter permease [Desulfarculus sp.]
MESQPQHSVIIKAHRGWAALRLGEVWEFRELLYFLVWREIKGRYRQMALGPLWIVLKPFITMVVFTLVFGRMAGFASDGLPYPLFSFAALLPWQFFTVAVSKSAGSLVSNMGVISKVYFPRLVVPLSTAFTGLVDFFMAFVIVLLMMVYYGVFPGWQVVFLPAFLLLALATALAAGLWLATLAVKYRDVSFAVEHLLQVFMYLTPVVYPSSMVPEAYRFLYRLNPMVGVIEGFRWSLLGSGPAPDLALVISSGIVALALVSGAFFFARTERNIVDLL